MCNITKEYKPGYHAQVGYKVAVQKPDGKYYSPFTGVEYKVGKVAQPDYNKDVEKIPIVCDVIGGKNNNSFYQDRYVGCTAIFINKSEAVENMIGLKHRLDDRGIPIKLVMLEFKLSGIKYKGTYEFGEDIISAPVFMGTRISSMKKIYV